MTTNQATDLRIDGDGFFVVRANEDSEMLLTRAGNFTLDANRQLVTADGYFVLTSEGEIITLDEEITAFSIGQDGTIMGVTADATEAIAQIGVATVVNPSGLEKLGGNMYRVTANANPDASVEDYLSFAGDPEFGTGSMIPRSIGNVQCGFNFRIYGDDCSSTWIPSEFTHNHNFR